MSNVKHIKIIGEYNPYLADGEEWDYVCKIAGLFLLTPNTGIKVNTNEKEDNKIQMKFEGVEAVSYSLCEKLIDSISKFGTVIESQITTLEI